MALSNESVAAADPAPKVSAEQTSDGSWPKPGDEGYVTPDGTEQAKRQLAENRQAAADRMAAGSTVHGAPMATPGPQMRTVGEAAVARAESYDGPTDADRKAGVTQFIREGFDKAADEAAKADEGPKEAAPVAEQRTADTSGKSVQR